MCGVACNDYLAPGRGAKHCDQRVCLSAFLFAFMFVRISQRPHVNILHMLFIAVVRSSSDSNAIRHVLLVLLMTSFFHKMERMGQNQRRRFDAHVSSSSPGGGTGAKSASQTAFYCL